MKTPAQIFDTDWVASEKAENNWLIRSLLGNMDIPEITSSHFDEAVEFIDRKVLVGTIDI